jgi:6-pyruvoyltetrahydropterin/6-carboxytetrahydropterin synthase
MYELTIAGHFAAAHYLKGYEGQCKNLHGHTWKLEITIQAEQLDEIGVVMDFKILKERLHNFLKRLDHGCLNDLPEFKEENPTTENLARFVYREFAPECQPFKIKKVQVWESDKASVIYFE